MRRALVVAALALLIPLSAMAAVETFGDGVHLVGRDIKPGTYGARVQEGSGCYWERLSGLTGEFDDIIANDNPAPGPAYVTIEMSDMAFSSSGCGTWYSTTAGSPTPTPVVGTTTGATPYADFLTGMLGFAQRVVDNLPDKPKAFARFGQTLSDDMSAFLATVVPEDCYRDQYIGAWHVASAWGIVAGLAGSRDLGEIRAFSAIYTGPLFASVLDQMRVDSTCTA